MNNSLEYSEDRKMVIGVKDKSIASVTIPDSVTSIGEYNQEIKGETNVEIIPVSA